MDNKKGLRGSHIHEILVEQGVTKPDKVTKRLFQGRVQWTAYWSYFRKHGVTLERLAAELEKAGYKVFETYDRYGVKMSTFEVVFEIKE